MKFKPEISLQRRIVVALIVSIVSMGLPTTAAASATGIRPQLFLNVLIEGLDAAQLDLLRDYLGDKGFNRLYRDGVIMTADYGTPLDQTAAAATLMTGAAPSVNGVSGALHYDRTARRMEPVFYDANMMGNFTADTYSPSALKVSTLSDEARIAGGGVTHVYAVAPDASTALALGGHSGNCALWIDDQTGNWATTTYYTEVPTVLSSRNRLSPLASRIDTITWTPLRHPYSYPDLPEHLGRYSFKYTFNHGNQNRFADFKTAPALVNAEVTSMAIDIINQLKLGHHDGVDVLSVAYTLAPYQMSKNADSRFELIDSYYRLDEDIAKLLAAAERQTGVGNSVVLITGTPLPSRTRRDDSRWLIPYGEFSTRKAMSLLNVYLIALHGSGEWVSSYADGWLFLNDKLIEERHADAALIRAEAAEFLERMSGVKSVYTSDDVRLGLAGNNGEALRRNIHHSERGDLLINVLPGWQLIDDSNGLQPPAEFQHVYREVPPTAPVILMAPNLNPRTISTPLDVRMVAPTLCRLLRIRSPNAASLPALNL